MRARSRTENPMSMRERKHGCTAATARVGAMKTQHIPKTPAHAEAGSNRPAAKLSLGKTMLTLRCRAVYGAEATRCKIFLLVVNRVRFAYASELSVRIGDPLEIFAVSAFVQRCDMGQRQQFG